MCIIVRSHAAACRSHGGIPGRRERFAGARRGPAGPRPIGTDRTLARAHAVAAAWGDCPSAGHSGSCRQYVPMTMVMLTRFAESQRLTLLQCVATRVSSQEVNPKVGRLCSVHCRPELFRMMLTLAHAAAHADGHRIGAVPSRSMAVHPASAPAAVHARDRGPA